MEPLAIDYRIQPARPAAHLFEVHCTIPDPDPKGQVFSLPSWIPGSYMIRDFAKNVVEIEAYSEDVPLPIRKLDKQTWRCGVCDGPLALRYEVYAWDLSVRSAHLDITHAYFNGTSVFVQVQGREDRPCRVELLGPAGEAFANWRVATAMPRAAAPPHGFGTYQTESYDELIDHPVEMGAFSLASFEACGVSHDVVISGRHRADLERLCTDLKTACEHHVRFFGEPAPMDRYVFLISAVGQGYGGLEHRASSSLLCSRDDLPLLGQTEDRERYHRFLALCSHEYFHTWNVKRIKPQVFCPYDLQREVHTRLLWAFEGITSYYDELALVRTGLISVEEYLEMLSQTITQVWRGSGRFKQSIAESSFDTWTKFYKQDENASNAIVSYYTKGSLLALALDLTIRLGTDDRVSLDTVMRVLWERYGKPGQGVAEDAMVALVREVTGMDLGDFFQRYLYGVEDLPLAALLPRFGVAFRLRPAESSQDEGGKPAKGALRERATLGARVVADGASPKLAVVFDDGPAEAAGLAAGDRLVAVDGLEVRAADLDERIQRYSVGDTLHVHAFRGGELLEFDITLAPAPIDTCVLSLLEDLDTETQERHQAWLSLEAINDRPE